MEMMDCEANVRVMHALVEAWNDHDSRRVADLFTDDYIGDDVGISGQLHGPRDIRRYVLYNLLGFPDLHFELHDTIAEGNKVVIVWTVIGTHQGRVMNIPPTGQPVRAQGISVFTLRDGKICHSLRVWDVAGMLRNIGLLPDLPALS